MTNALYLVAAIVGLTAVTVLTRSSFFLLPARIELPGRVERALRYAPACALAATIAPAVLARGGDVSIAWDNHQMWGLAAATLVAFRTRSMVLVIAVGMTVFTVLRLIS
jgi:branched-subunit amino acid transport protein